VWDGDENTSNTIKYASDLLNSKPTVWDSVGK